MDLHTVHGVKLFPQGSSLEPLLFNIFFCDLVLEHEGCCFTNYADGTTPYVIQINKTGNQKINNAILVVDNLTNFTQKLFMWFASNQMKV